MSNEDRLKGIEVGIKQAEVHEEQCRLNLLIAQGQTETLKKEREKCLSSSPE